MRFAEILKGCAICAAALSVLGCGGERSALIQEHADLADEVFALVCLCPANLGYGSIDECRAALGEIDEADKQCLDDALEANGAAGEDYLTCANAVLSDYTDCLFADPGCAEGWAADCQVTRDAGLDACPGQAARSSIAACTN